ncbi:PKD domain-containing protein [Candidatus Woesearchaeota archaeon]|nr:PKD domain-containing protein [Candidatus Woesearchaeota archaeon]
MKNKLMISKLFAMLLLLLLVVAPLASALGNDNDRDFIDDDIDNCPYNSNINQANTDWKDLNNNNQLDVGEDALGDVCDDNMADPVITTGDQAVDEEVTLEFTALANNGGDAVFADTLFVAVEGALPTGMTTQDVTTNDDQKLKTKKFTWKPTKTQGGQNYQLTLVATDGPIQDGDAARVVKKTITIAVKDTIKDQPLPVNHQPVADFVYSPADPKAFTVVQFTETASDADGDELTYAWDFENDGSVDSTEANPSYQFTSIGNHQVRLTVTEKNTADHLTATVVKTISITEIELVNGLEITSLQCFENVIVGKEQVCGIKVKDLTTNKPAVGAEVTLLFDDTKSTIGKCKTDINGGCIVEYIAEKVGTFTVTSYATKVMPNGEALWDLSQNLKFTYNVLDHAYDIVNLGIFNSTQNMNLGVEDHEYYRGEGFFIKFQVVDKNDNNKLITDPDLVTKATLVSTPGGFVDLAEFQKLNDGFFYFNLDAIPLTHDYKGDSNVFTFAFNFKENKGGEAKVQLNILNNPPKIVGEIPDMAVEEQKTFTFDLTPYESDLEDSGDNLFWGVSGADESLFTASVVGKVLTIVPIKEGVDTITLTLRDLDGDIDKQDVVVTVVGGNATLPLAVAINADKTSGEVPLTVQFTSAVSNAVGDVTYIWNFGDGVDAGIAANQANPSHTFAKVGVYTVQLTIVDSAQNTATDSLVIEVKEKALPQDTIVVLSATPTEGKAPLIVIFSTEGTASTCEFTLDLDFGDGSNHASVDGSNNFVATHIYQNAGKYTATLTVNAGACGVFTKTVVITAFDADNYGQGKSVTSRGVVEWNRLQLLTGEEYSAGDVAAVLVDFHNDGDNEMQNARIAVTIPELGVRRSLGPVDINEGASFTEIIYLQLPFDATAGVYDILATVHGDNVGNHDEDVHRIKFRQITIN